MKLIATNKNILRLAAPISLSLLIPQISFLTNTAFLGRLGERELGVNGIAGILYLTLTMIGYGWNSGVQIQLARRAGEGDQNGLSRTFANGLVLNLFFSLGMILISWFAAPFIFKHSLHDVENARLNSGFLFIRMWGIPFLMLTQAANTFFISIGRSRFIIYGSLVGTVANILFDYLFIFGKAGFPEMGLNGAAVASVIAEVIACLVMFAIMYFRRFYREYPWHRYLELDGKLSGRSIKVAAPLIVQFLFSIGGWVIFFIFVEHLGTHELAASQILRSIFGIVGVGTWALATTCNTMVSNNIGQGKPSMVLYIVQKISKLSLLYAIVLCAFLLIFSNEFLSLYRDDPALVAFAQPSLRVIVAASLIMALSTVVFNGVVGTGNTIVNLTIEITCVLTYLVYCFLVIEKMRWPLHWAWGSEFVYWSSLLLIATWYLKSGRWKGKKI